MSMIDNLIRGMRFNSDDADDDDLDDDMEDGHDDDLDGRDSRSRFSFGGRRSSRDAEDEDEDEPAPKSGRGRGRQGVQNPPAISGRRSGGSGSMQVRIIKPSSFDQAKEITDTLLSHRTVLLNLEGLDVNTAQRIVDFASGSCYALHGNFMKISHFIIVITPEDVDIAGDISMENGQELGTAGVMGMLGAMNNGGMIQQPMDSTGYMQQAPQPMYGQN